jgi:dihydroorotate dehydrogenase electron transfer subunit
MKEPKVLQVIENKPIAAGIYSLELYHHALCEEVLPGQFFHIKCGGDKFPLLRRPISLSYTKREKGAVVLIYRVQGQGTEFLSSRRPGDSLDVLGPLGSGFEADRQYERVAIVGGGIGIAPLVELAGIYGDRAAVFAGYRDETFLLKELQERSADVRAATEDGSFGYDGFVTDLLLQYLKEQRTDMVFACGPKPMLKTVAKICRENSVGCQVSLEERMACGVGACLGCSCAVNERDGSLQYKRVCKDGPVFRAEEVCWDE